MSPVLLLSLISCLVAPAFAQYQESVPCAVSDAYDFQSGIANVDCSVLELQNSIALTASSFSSGAFVINDQNITIQASTPDSASATILDFGTYALDGKVSVTGSSVITITDLALQNYAGTSVLNGSISTFMALFSFDSTSALYTSNVQYLVDAGSCLLDKNYTNELAIPRTSW